MKPIIDLETLYETLRGLGNDVQWARNRLENPRVSLTSRINSRLYADSASAAFLDVEDSLKAFRRIRLSSLIADDKRVVT